MQIKKAPKYLSQWFESFAVHDLEISVGKIVTAKIDGKEKRYIKVAKDDWEELPCK